MLHSNIDSNGFSTPEGGELELSPLQTGSEQRVEALQDEDSVGIVLGTHVPLLVKNRVSGSDAREFGADSSVIVEIVLKATAVRIRTLTQATVSNITIAVDDILGSMRRRS